MSSRTTIEDYFTRQRNRRASGDVVQDDKGAVDIWQPRQEYEDTWIANLDPGPKKVRLTVRVVNIYDMHTSSKCLRAAKGCFKVLAKDNTGCILINLWYIEVEYRIGIGSLLTIWSPHVSPKTERIQSSPARLTTSIFPERDSSCGVVVHIDTLSREACRIPLGYREGHPFSGLSSLRDLAESTRTNLGSRVLLLVRGIGIITRVTNSKGKATDRVDIGVCDESGEAVLTLYGMMIQSVSQWIPFSTVLLVSGASWRPTYRLSVTADTMIEVDPDIVEAEWLRKSPQRATNHINRPYADDVFDVKGFESAAIKLRFTLADIDEFIRAQPHEIYMGYMNLLITEVNLLPLYKRERLYSTQCCNMPAFANVATATCGQCGDLLKLSLNPQIIGALTDETGSVSGSSLSCYNTKAKYQPFCNFGESKKFISSPVIWSLEAWHTLLGVEPDKLLESIESSEEGSKVLASIQSHLLFLRITIIFGWSNEYGKLVVCRVVP